MQMGISDAGTSRECECVAFAESGVRLDGNVVTLGGVLLLLDLVFYGRREAALVGEYPGLAAFAFEEHDLAITEWGDLDFSDVAVLWSVDGPAFFHLRGVVDAGMVTRAAIFTKRGCQISIAFERIIRKRFYVRFGNQFRWWGGFF